ncbi:hypothetical protein M8J75_004681 [Diaphorina citri]|nr:hypothetical protein M8J75_004681 [Diaphorina citri]
MSSVRPEIQLKLGAGLHLEENQAIVYESSVPLVYEMNWEDPKDLQEDVSIVPDTTKWAQCYSNSTCTLRKIFSDYRKAINIQLDNLEPHLVLFKSKQRRLGVMGWILDHCCGVATQDESFGLRQCVKIDVRWWSQNLTTHHIIPSTWISLPKEDIGKVLQNDSLQYEAKLNALLSEGWETKPKSVFVVPESVSEDVSLYSKFRESAGEYHVEWTTVVTVLVIIILFRQPINILLVRLVSCGGRDDPPDGFHRP